VVGITALELMPVHQFAQDPHLKERGLSNYWGYNTIGFFAPHNAYSSSVEFRLPGTAIGEKWHVAVDTFQNGETGPELHAGGCVHMEARSILVLTRQ
jgi:pullulanase/glycogen debranching enzyme